MSTQAAQAKLKDAHRELLIAWHRVAQGWQDEAAATFHKEVVEPIEPRIGSALNAMSEMGEVLARARREMDEQ